MSHITPKIGTTLARQLWRSSSVNSARLKSLGAQAKPVPSEMEFASQTINQRNKFSANNARSISSTCGPLT